MAIAFPGISFGFRKHKKIDFFFLLQIGEYKMSSECPNIKQLIEIFFVIKSSCSCYM